MTQSLAPTRTVGQVELARLANVSQKTVSRALRGGDDVSQATRERIQRLAEQHQYRPNAAARSTRSGRFGSIALLLGTKDGRSTLPQDMLNGIADALYDRDLNLAVVKLDDEQLTDARHVPRILREAASDGMLIDYTHAVPPGMERLIEGFGLPAVWINTAREHNCVRPDDRAAGRAAAEHLLQLGHRRIALADFTHGPDFVDPHYSAADRRAGYADAMIDAGLEPRVIVAEAGEGVPSSERPTFAGGVLGGSDRPTAVIAYSQTTAIPFHMAAVARGLSVPGDLSLVSFDNRAVAHLGPLYTTFSPPQEQVGREAVVLLTQRLNKHRDLPAVAVPFTFEPGQTTTPISV